MPEGVNINLESIKLTEVVFGKDFLNSKFDVVWGYLGNYSIFWVGNNEGGNFKIVYNRHMMPKVAAETIENYFSESLRKVG